MPNDTVHKLYNRIIVTLEWTIELMSELTDNENDCNSAILQRQRN